MKKILLTILILLFSLSVISAQEGVEEKATFKGVVSDVNEVDCGNMLDDQYTCYTYKVFVKELDMEIEAGPASSETGESRFKVGDRIYVSNYSLDDVSDWNIVGFSRESSVLFMFIIFTFVTILVGGKKGLSSIISLGITFLLLYFFAIPRMLDGGNVLFLGIITVLVSMVSSMYVAHGFNRRTTLSVISTFFGILIVSLFALFFTNITRLDGLGTEDAFFLSSQTGGAINLSQLYFVSILVAAMGVLDDVIVSQVVSVYELYDANIKLNANQLYSKAMNIGKEHISSMVNTLFVAYAGSSLALVMLLSFNNGSVAFILRSDSITEEIVRTLAASIGIILVVPVSTFLASRFVPLFKDRI
jgi:uncharacterized membrane protein